MMTNKEVRNRIKSKVSIPIEKDSRKLLSALNLPLPEEQPKKAKKKAWIPAVALTCTAAIAVAVCVPVYLHMQENNGIVGGVTSSAPEEKLVWGMGGGLKGDNYSGPIDEELQKAMDDPQNEGKLFCIRATAPLSADENFVFEGESMASMQQKIDQIIQQIEATTKEFYDKYPDVFTPEAAEQYNKETDRLSEFYRQYFDQKEKIRIASLKAQIEELSKQLPSDIKISAIEETSDLLEYGGECYSEVTKDQIEQLVTLGFKDIRLTIPARVEGYDRRIADSLVAMLEYEPQETYFVRVNSVLCKQTKYGNENYNADLIRKLKDEEITQEFGDNFLAAIRERHGIEDKYVPYIYDGYYWYEKDKATVKPTRGDWQVDSYTSDNGETGKAYFGGFFEAKLTKEQILELAEDPDVRSIYPAISEYEYNKGAED